MVKFILAVIVHFALGPSSLAAEPAYRTVTLDQFTVGNCWLWTYFEKNKQTGTWAPYYFERYTVTEADGKKLTLEMSSSSARPILSAAHHKMDVDFSKCESSAQDPRFKNFTIVFYTKSMGEDGRWQLVSRAHKNLVFTEKFNCWGALPNEKIVTAFWPGPSGSKPIFQVERVPPREASWYFLAEPGLEGVAALKIFDPAGEYKMEFTQAGTACQ